MTVLAPLRLLRTQAKRLLRRFAIPLSLYPAISAYSQSPPKWHLIEVWRKGGAVDGAYSFDKINDRIGDISAMPGGKVVVLNPETSVLSILDSAGVVARSFARRGSGPGEFQNAYQIAVAHDGRIAVNDVRNGRIVLFNANGEFARTVPIQRTPVFAFDIWWDASFDRSGRMLTSLSIRAKVPRPPPGSTAGMPASSFVFDSTIVTERWTADFSRSDSLTMCGAPPPIALNTTQHFMFTARAPAPSEEKQKSGAPPAPVASVGWLPIPFAEQKPAFVRDRDGYEWSPSAMGSAELLRRENGKCASVSARVTLRGPRAPIPAALRNKQVNDARPEMRSRIPREYPWFHALHVDDENRLWVERDVVGGKRFDVFSSTGQPVAEIDAPVGLEVNYPIAIGNGRLYGFVKTADDIPYLVSWRIQR